MGYTLTFENLHLPCSNGETLTLCLTSNSGRIVTRKKIDTLLGVNHPGIELAVDQHGYRWIAHHHYLNKYPTIDREDKYADGNVISYAPVSSHFTKREILERTMHYWWNGKEYQLFSQNCQHFVNIIAYNEHRSDAMDKASDAMVLASLLGIFGGIATGNSSLVKLGIGIGIAGGATKLISTNPQPKKALPYSNNQMRI
jgi:hypothetical protein